MNKNFRLFVFFVFVYLLFNVPPLKLTPLWWDRNAYATSLLVLLLWRGIVSIFLGSKIAQCFSDLWNILFTNSAIYVKRLIHI